MPVKVRQLIKKLEAAGWRHVRTSGDHRVFHSADGRITVVSGKLGDDIRPVTYRAVLPSNWYQGKRMTRKYSLIIEGDSSGYSGYIPELPTIVVTGVSVDELTDRAKEAISVYWTTIRIDQSPTATVREIEVDLPA